MGDAQAFAEIIRRHAGIVYGAALRILADVDRASDVAQETFLQLTKDAHSVTGSLPGWLHRVATHKAIDQMRRDASRRRREVEYTAKKPREVTDWKDLSRHVDEELSRLDSETREMLVAHFLQGQTTRQIALNRGVSQATVSRRVDAGITQLRATLRKRGILVAAGVLSTLLGKNAVQAVPSALMMELGKMAIVGGHAAVGAAGASTMQVIGSGVLAGVKAKVVAVAAVAVIGTGTVVTYQHATRRPSPQSTVITRSATPRAPTRTVASAPASAPQPTPASAVGPSDAAKRWAELMGGGRAGVQRSQPPTPAPQQAMEAPPVEEPAPTPQGGMGGSAMPTAPTSQEDRPQEAPAPTGGMYYSYRGYGGTRVVNLPSGPNDANNADPNGR